MVIEDDVKGVRNELMMAIDKTTFLLVVAVSRLLISLFIFV
jgi:hypothetical protein